MSQHKLSTDAFRQLIMQQLKEVCAERGWNYDNNAQRGWAFQFWVADLVCRREGLEADPEECTFLNNDCGIDIILEDQDQKRYHFIQTKLMRYSTRIEEPDVSHLCDRHNLFLDRPWVTKHVTQEMQFDVLGGYEDLLKNGYTVHYYLIATGSASERVKDVTAIRQAEVNREEPAVSFEVMDFTALKEFYIEAETLEQSIPERVEFQLPQGSFTIKDKPHKTLLAVVKGNALVNLYRKERERLFAYNIRSYLGRKGLNKDIITTAEGDPGSFYYFNNGVSAICTSFDVDELNILAADNFQIINGAQTLGALNAAKLNSDIEVLLRVTEGLSIKTDRGFNADIIKYNNTQNIVKSSDFRSNDRIQTWLENKFKNLRDRGAVTKITYMRKRTNRRVAGTYVVRLEDLAKIRHTFNFEPTRSVADPKSLWTMQADGGSYEEAFGVDGEIRDFWPEEDFSRTLLAIALYKAIEDKISASIRRDKTFLFLRRLRFFALGLAAVYFELKYANKTAAELLRSDAEFRKLFDDFWLLAIRELNDAHYQATEVDKISGFALVRSEQRWRL
jgi:AIPR protein/Restriction endonuclease